MKIKGFTLIEMLVIFIINGVIIAIMIPYKTNLTTNYSKKAYKVQMNVIEKATKLYVLKNKNQLLSIDNDCIIIDYEIIKNNQGIDENNISCSGSIILKTTNTNAFIYNYDLNCKDKYNNYYKYDEEELPTNCTIFPK